jgi:hypothetical protein
VGGGGLMVDALGMGSGAISGGAGGPEVRERERPLRPWSRSCDRFAQRGRRMSLFLLHGNVTEFLPPLLARGSRPPNSFSHTFFFSFLFHLLFPLRSCAQEGSQIKQKTVNDGKKKRKKKKNRTDDLFVLFVF